ncbi:MAG: ATP-binding cassette domain-containing protein [Oligosphaeraceae bacterium]|nr:ATP-binding cassette domain-containing protein [Oligosphaeraceae bacterium]
MMLALNNIGKKFLCAGEEVVLFDHFSLTLRSGEAKVLLGPSGSGKTTLLRIIAGLERPDAGEVLFDGQARFQGDQQQQQEFRHRQIGLSDQFARLLPQLTALENVLLPALGLKQDCRPRGRALLQQFGLANRADFFPQQLSGGERQRVALARAMLLQPPLLLLDEPTAALDAGRSRSLLALIQSLNRQQQVSVLLASHDPTVLEFFPDTVTLQQESDRK